MKHRKRYWLRWLIIISIGSLVVLGVSIYRLTRYLGGWEKPWHVVVLLQNNMELRPTGGYLGSYAEFWVENGQIKKLNIDDIGWPNGQIKGYVKEPEPIRKYLFKGDTPGWRLRDSNFDPDFTQAARDVNWFMVEGGIEPADVMVAVNLLPVKDFLSRIGEVTLADYEEPVTADNLYQQAQYAAEHGFFDGSTQKGDFLGALGRELFRRLEANRRKWGPVLLQTGFENLKTKQIMVTALTDERLEWWFDVLNWNGKMRGVPCVGQTCMGDYLYINEANLGINKTNCCLERFLEDFVEVEGETVRHRLILRYVNHNPLTPEPPVYWGGGYKAYTRIYVPSGATVSAYLVDGVEQELGSTIDYENGEHLAELGFLLGVPGLGETTVSLDYWYTAQGRGTYRLLEQKQSGIEYWPIHRTINGTTYDYEMDRDRHITHPL